MKRIPTTNFCAALAAGVLLGAIPAWADITVTALETVSAGPQPPKPAAVRLFFKGADTRLETTGAPTLLYEGKDNILYGLDSVHRTYYLTVPTETEPTSEMPAEAGRQISQDAKLDLHQTDQTQTLAGQTARKYVVSGTVKFTRTQSPPGAGGRRGGRRRGGGGFPGGGSSGGGFPGGGSSGGGFPGGADRSLVLPQWTLSGEIWLADTLRFPAKQNTRLAAELVAGGAGPLEAPLADALEKHKGLPLLARITVTVTPGATRGIAAPAPVSTATTFMVQSVSSDPLAAAIFTPPLADTLVTAPPVPYVPGTPL